MFNSNPLKELKKRKSCTSKGTVCFTIEQNILVDLKQVWGGGRHGGGGADFLFCFSFC